MLRMILHLLGMSTLDPPRRFPDRMTDDVPGVIPLWKVDQMEARELNKNSVPYT